MTTATWGFDSEAESRLDGWLKSAWRVARWVGCAAMFALCVSIPFGFNYEQNHARGWYFVAFALVSSILAPAMVSSLASLNLGKLARAFCSLIMICCLCYDWSQAARVHAANSDTQHADASFKQTESTSATKDRERLEREIEAADIAADRKPVGKLEAELQIAAAKAESSWETYTTRKGLKKVSFVARPQRFRDAVTQLQGKLAAAKERDKKELELKGVHVAQAAPSAADSGIETVRNVLQWFGITGLSDATLSRILALYDTGLMQFLCLVGPHGTFLFLFRALSPDLAERQRLQAAREKGAREGERKARRATRSEVWKRYRRRIESSVKARFERKAPPKVPDPEPVPDTLHDDDHETAVEPPVKVVPEAPQPVASNDPTLNAIINSGLQRADGLRVSTKEFFNKVWVPWHHERGLDPGKQTGMTKRLKAEELFEMFKAGSETWIADHAIRAKNERPKFRVVS